MDLTRRDFIKGLGALAGVAVASQFDCQLEMLARGLSGPQEWVLTVDERGLEKLCERVSVGAMRVEGNRAIAECSLEISESDIWVLATLTAPGGAEWKSADGKNWTCGDGRMTL